MGKTLSSADVIKELERAGWVHVRTKGSHAQFVRAGQPGRVTVPLNNRDLAKGTLRSIERQSGLRF